MKPVPRWRGGARGPWRGDRSRRRVARRRFLLATAALAAAARTQGRAGFGASYGPALGEGYRRLATFVARVLKGARASDLPVELPTRIEPAVNLRTARALGGAIPSALRLRADEVVA